MQTYIGTKLIEARLESEFTFKAEKEGRGQPVDSTTVDRDGYRVRYPDGYESWSPKEAFEEAYRENGKFDFGMALFLLKKGERLQRAGWNGRGMFVYLVPANEYPADGNKLGTMKGIFPSDMVPYGPYIAMKTAQNNVVPWLCSQTDMMAEDWQIIE